jgi:hypothetical protein
MTRRQLLALAALAIPLACQSNTSQPSRGSRKKGLCLSAKMRSPQKVAKFLEAVHARWIYNWNLDAPEILPAGIDFVPMIYNGRAVKTSALARAKAQSPANRHGELLGFNEPDAQSQGNTSVEQALDAWPKLEKTGLRLGSPGCVHPDNEWMIAFMKGVEKRGLRVDFVCMHSYGGPGVDSFLKKIHKVHEMFKRPIWITEFAVADWEAKSPGENRHQPEKIADFVAKLLPQLEAMDIVERYAWFHGGVSGNALATSKLFNPDGSLTTVGKAYRSVA